MNTPLRTPGLVASWPRLMALLWLMVAGLLPGRTLAQTTGASGGTLSPATSSVCAGFNSGTLTLTGYTGSIIKYQADSGNGYVDIASNSPTYTFSNLQTTTSFRAIVQNGTNPAVASTVATVTVGQPPTATINSQGPTTFCQQGTIYLVAGPVASGNTYQFLLNGREIVGATSPTYTTLVTAATSSYSVEVTNATGCSSISASVIVRVLSQNVVTLNATTPTTFCQGSSVLLSANVSGQGASGYTYQFEKDGAQIPGATNSTYSATTSGAYRVVVYNPSTCSATSNTINVTATPPPAVSLGYTLPSYCQSGPSNPTPTASPSGGTFSSSASGLSLNPNTGAINLSQSQPGTYAVAYNVGGTCPASATTTVSITAAPTADFSYVGGTRCAGTTGSLTPTLAAGATGGTYSASPAGLSLNAGTGAIDVAQSQAGTYTITNSLAAANGCSATSASTSLVLNAQPTPALTAGSATTFCQGGAVTLTATGGASGATYQFLNNGQAISGATASSYSATASGSYTVLITNQSGCSATSGATAVTVNALPAQPTLTLTNGVLSTSAVAGATYQYYLNGAAIAGATSPTYTTTQSGSYTVIVSANGCASAPSAAVSVTITASRSGQAVFGLAVFPNPTTGLLTVTMDGGHAPAQLAVYNALGQQVLTSALAATATSRELNLSALPAGVYVLRAVTSGGIGTRRLVRQ